MFRYFSYRCQSEAIARNLIEMMNLTVPIVSVVIGEGGSGGALALGVGDRILMLEHAVYSVISPEGCAAILWNDPSKTSQSAEALKLTAKDLVETGIIDQLVAEPPGGAHRDPSSSAQNLEEAIESQLSEIDDIPRQDLVRQRYEKYRNIGVFAEERS